MNSPAITVCVSTHNRQQLLPQLVGHLEAQTLGVENFEVVIVDDGSTDDTWATLQQLVGTSRLTMRIHRNATATGPAGGRNRAWRDARAPLCAFTDDDCMPTPGWLASAVEGIGSSNAIGAGRIIWPPSDEPLLGAFSRSVTVLEGNARWGATANLIVRTSHLQAVNGFDETFRFPAGEDTDLLWRILELGADFAFLRDATVYHRVERAGFRALVRDQRRWADIPAVIARHPEARKALLHRRYFWRDTHPRALLLLAGAAATPVTPLFALLSIPWLHHRLCGDPIAEARLERVAILPGRLLLDVVEIWTMLRGSAKYKSFVI